MYRILNEEKMQQNLMCATWCECVCVENGML